MSVPHAETDTPEIDIHAIREDVREATGYTGLPERRLPVNTGTSEVTFTVPETEVDTYDYAAARDRAKPLIDANIARMTAEGHSDKRPKARPLK